MGFGNTCLMETAFTMPAMVEMILKHPNVQKQEVMKQKLIGDVPNHKLESPLFKAANFGLLKVVELLIEHGVDINHQDKERQTALFKARTVPIIDFLIERGANVNIQNLKGETPIFAAASNRMYTLLSRFHSPFRHQEQKTDLNHQDNEGNTFAHLIAKKHDWESMNWVLHQEGFESTNIRIKNNESMSVYDLIIEDKSKGNKQANSYFDSITTQKEENEETQMQALVYQTLLSIDSLLLRCT